MTEEETYEHSAQEIEEAAAADAAAARVAKFEEGRAESLAADERRLERERLEAIESARKIAEFGQRMASAAMEEAKAERQIGTTATDDAARAAAAEDRYKAWVRMVPIEYRETNPAHPNLFQAALDACQRWNCRSHLGLGMVGHSGLGKTRCLTLALERAFVAGRSVLWIQHVEFADFAVQASKGKEAAQEMMKLCKTVDVLLLDDLGKAANTERALEALEHVTEYRVARRRPILWSAQAGSKWMKLLWGADKGEAIARRLNEFCHCPKLPREKEPVQIALSLS